MKKKITTGLLSAVLLTGGLIGFMPGTVFADTLSVTVKKSDTLYKIATKYGVTVDELKKENGLKTNAIKVGSTLKVSTSYGTYKVKKGDTLYSLAKIHHTSVYELKKVNHLTSSALYTNEIILLPKTLLENQLFVKKGDTLYSLAKKHGTTVNELKKMNKLTSSRLYVGQVLTVSTIKKTVTITPEKGYKVVANNDGTYRIYAEKDSNFYMIIEPLGKSYDKETQRMAAKKSLSSLGEVHEANTAAIDSVYSGLDMLVTVNTSNLFQSVMVKKVQNDYVKITSHLPALNSDEISPPFVKMIEGMQVK